MVESIDELRKICQKTDEFPWPERRVSIYITKLLLKTPITANQVTLIDFILGLIGNIFLFFGNSLNFLIGALFLELFSIFDCVDGEVARYRKSRTAFSEFYQDLAHPFIHPVTYICLSFGLYNAVRDVSVFVFGFTATLATFVNPHLNLQREKIMSTWDHVRTYRIMKNTLDKKIGTSLTNVIAYIFQDIGAIIILNLCTGIEYLKTLIPSLQLMIPILKINFVYLYLILYSVALASLMGLNLIISMRLLKQI